MSLVEIFLYSFVTLAWLFMLSVLLVTWPPKKRNQWPQNGLRLIYASNLPGAAVQKPGEVWQVRERGNKIGVRPDWKAQPVLPTKLRYELRQLSGEQRKSSLNSGLDLSDGRPVPGPARLGW